jgi:hypothetical protein
MPFTLGEAARQCQVAKGTISKAIKTGKLSATRREDGSWSIDNAELARYLDANGHRFRSQAGSTDQPETDQTDVLVGALRETIVTLKQQLARAEQQGDEWREQLKREQEMRLMLTAQKPAAEPPKPTPKPPPTWAQWFGFSRRRAG